MLDRDSRRALADLLATLLSRLLFTPLTWLLPRDPRRVVVIGREGGKFLDNAKYFYCWLEHNRPDGCRPAFLSEHAATREQLRAAGATEVLAWPGLRGGWALLRAGTLVFDTADALDHGRLGLMTGACWVQIWHGAPLKEIELPLHQRRLASLSPLPRLALRLYKALTARFPRFDLLVSTSAWFTEHAFGRCFRARQVVATGYPRNDMLFTTPDYPARLTALNTDLDALARLREVRAGGRRTVLYAPTFRQDKHSPFEAGWVDLAQLSAFAARHQIEVVLKLHPLLQHRRQGGPLPHIIEVAPASDAYPLLPEIDILVTDYSSIYFDYLLLDRPLVFYPYDFAAYTADDRRLLFDYEAMTPGPKAGNLEELMDLLRDTLAGEDAAWRIRRQQVRALTFDDPDGGASRRLWTHIQRLQRGPSA